MPLLHALEKQQKTFQEKKKKCCCHIHRDKGKTFFFLQLTPIGLYLRRRKFEYVKANSKFRLIRRSPGTEYKAACQKDT